MKLKILSGVIFFLFLGQGIAIANPDGNPQHKQQTLHLAQQDSLANLTQEVDGKLMNKVKTQNPRLTATEAGTKLTQLKDSPDSASFKDAEKFKTLAEQALRMRQVDTMYRGSDAQVKAFAKNYNANILLIQSSIIKAIKQNRINDIQRLTEIVQEISNNFDAANQLAQGKDPRTWYARVTDFFKHIFKGENVTQASQREAITKAFSRIWQQTRATYLVDKRIQRADNALTSAASHVADADTLEAYEEKRPKGSAQQLTFNADYESLKEQLQTAITAIDKVAADYNSLDLSQIKREAYINKLERLTMLAQGLANYKAILDGTSPLKILAGDEVIVANETTGLADLSGSKDTALQTVATEAVSKEIQEETVIKLKSLGDFSALSESEDVIHDEAAIEAKAGKVAAALDKVVSDDIEESLDILASMSALANSHGGNAMATDIEDAVSKLNAVKKDLTKTNISILTGLKGVENTVEKAVNADTNALNGTTIVDQRVRTLRANIMATANQMNNPNGQDNIPRDFLVSRLLKTGPHTFINEGNSIAGLER